MTENEAKAIRFIENIKNHAMVTLDHIAREEPNVSPLLYKGREEKADTILAMVQELEQYRAIGTLEELKAAMKYVHLAKKHGTVGQVIENCVKYEEIGTPEECLQNKDFLDFLTDKMNPNDFETYFRIYNAQEEKGCEQ